MNFFCDFRKLWIALLQLICICLIGLFCKIVCATSTDAYIAVTPGSARSYYLGILPSPLQPFSFGYLGSLSNSDWTKRHTLADQVEVNGVMATVVKDAPQGYTEYWQFGGGAKLLRIDEGDYNDQLGIGVFNRQNMYTPAIPVVAQDATVGSTLSAQGTAVRIDNSVAPIETMQFTSQSVVTDLEMVTLDGSVHQAFRVVTTIEQSDSTLDFVLTLTNLFVEGIGLIPVQTDETIKYANGSASGWTIVKYTPLQPTSHPTTPTTIAPVTGIPPGALIDGVVTPGTNWDKGNLSSMSPLFPLATDVYVTNGQFAGQDHPPSSMSRMQNPSMIRVRAPTSPNATACAVLSMGPQSSGQFCATSSDMAGQPQSGILSLSDWGDFVGMGLAEFHTFTSFNARIFSNAFTNTLDKNFDLQFQTDSGVYGDLAIVMPDNGWLRPGIFKNLPRGNMSFGWYANGCNTSTSNLAILDVQYDANQNITSIAVDFGQHCENHPEALSASLRYNSNVPFTTFVPVYWATGNTLNMLPGWNLLGNSGNFSATVASLFTDPKLVESVWKWEPLIQNWGFYSPAPGDGGAAFAASKGYDYLTHLNGGEGFWVNAKTALTFQLPTGTAITSTIFSDKTTGSNNLPTGWSMIATGDNPTPRDFVNSISLNQPVLPAVAATNLTSLWAWDGTSYNWYFYAPSLDNSGTLTSYINSKNYEDFSAMNKTLDPTTGFWVNHQ